MDKYRLNCIVTKNGDEGQTSLADGRRISKADVRIQLLGAVDELNSHLGVVLAESLPSGVCACVLQIQQDLFAVGAELSLPQQPTVTLEHSLWLEQQLQQFNADLAPLVEFVLPGGCRAGALLHSCRALCRRGECLAVAMSQHDSVSAHLLCYLNRLSDLLFVLARYVNAEANAVERYWLSERYTLLCEQTKDS